MNEGSQAGGEHPTPMLTVDVVALAGALPVPRVLLVQRARPPFAGSWALSNLIGLGPTGALILDIVFVLLGVVVMIQFIRAAQKVEPFTASD